MPVNLIWKDNFNGKIWLVNIRDRHTWGKQIGIPPRIAFGGLNIACTNHQYSLQKKNALAKSRNKKWLWHMTDCHHLWVAYPSEIEDG
jgi:hypothetical protein